MIKKYKIKPKEVKVLQINRDIKSIAKAYFFVGKPMMTGLGYKNQKDWYDEVERLLKKDSFNISDTWIIWGEYLVKDGDFIYVENSDNLHVTYEEVITEWSLLNSYFATTTTNT